MANMDPESNYYLMKSSNQQFKNSHSHMFKLYKDEKFTDIEINVLKDDLKTKLGSPIKAHRIVLAANSDFFREKLQDPNVTSLDIVYDNRHYAFIRYCIGYCYNLRADLTNLNVRLVIATACFLQIPTLIQKCEEVIKAVITPQLCLSDRDFALKNDLTALYAYIDNYIRRHFQEIGETGEFKSCNFEFVEQLLYSDNLGASEIEIYDTLMNWVGENVPERKRYLATLFRSIRLPLMSIDELLEVSKNELIDSDLACSSFVKQVVMQKLNRTKFDEIPPHERLVSMKHFEPRDNATKDIPITFDEEICEIGTRVMMVIGGISRKGVQDAVMVSRTCQKDSWISLPKMNQKRYLPACVGIISPMTVYVFGGRGADYKNMASVEKYEEGSNKWVLCNPLPEPGDNFGIVSNGYNIYLVGGTFHDRSVKTLLKYDIISETWTHLANMSEVRGGPATVLSNGYIYAIGGFKEKNTCERYDISSNTWTTLCNLKRGRYRPGIVATGTSILVAGGGEDEETCKTLELYCTLQNIWKPFPALNIARKRLAMLIYKSKIYVVGGYSMQDAPVYEIERYNSSIKKWEIAGHLDLGVKMHSVLTYPFFKKQLDSLESQHAAATETECKKI